VNVLTFVGDSTLVGRLLTRSSAYPLGSSSGLCRRSRIRWAGAVSQCGNIKGRLEQRLNLRGTESSEMLHRRCL